MCGREVLPSDILLSIPISRQRLLTFLLNLGAQSFLYRGVCAAEIEKIDLREYCGLRGNEVGL